MTTEQEKMYKVILHVNNQNEVVLPITPDKITISNSDNTEITQLASGEPFTIAKLDGPQTFKFDFPITNRGDYPFVNQAAQHGVRFYTDLMWNIKSERNPIGLTILRGLYAPSTHVKVLLQDYSYVEDAEDCSDYTFSVTFVEWHNQHNQESPDPDWDATLYMAGDAYEQSFKGRAMEEQLGEWNYYNQQLWSFNTRRLADRGVEFNLISPAEAEAERKRIEAIMAYETNYIENENFRGTTG